jgi:hypothetical protein
MKTRPILFSAPMVRALLDGTKTQTRRICKSEEIVEAAEEFCEILTTTKAERIGPSEIGLRPVGHICKINYGLPLNDAIKTFCPYGQPGDRLWVRETTIDVEEHGYVGPVFVESDEGRAVLDGGLGQPDDFAEIEPHQLKKRPSIFMRRSMSRITLEITGVRIERLQGISGDDCLAEGIPERGTYPPESDPEDILRRDYRRLWESINGAGAWDANPWVWLLEFKRVTP